MIRDAGHLLDDVRLMRPRAGLGCWGIKEKTLIQSRLVLQSAWTLSRIRTHHIRHIYPGEVMLSEDE